MSVCVPLCSMVRKRDLSTRKIVMKIYSIHRLSKPRHNRSSNKRPNQTSR
ncbi:hypothetical protein EG68_12291 [Paragonimus skrjabini miyazakii]|uniref:Uncharacterized protein n=1 Tax=Paragonimus skrjabini miyazakii TaxID=59628 RepID=A0A8S9YNR0_9TREM|nr:hypothetical protein EG68_12291 [Paragonimus skrjabini miyazakii]